MSQANGKGPHNTEILSSGAKTGAVSLAGAAAEPTPAPPQATQINGEPEEAPVGPPHVTRTVPDQQAPMPMPVPALAPPMARSLPTQPGRGGSGGATSKVWIVGGGFFALGVLATVGFVLLRNGGGSTETKGDTTVPITTHSSAPVATPTNATPETPAANPTPPSPQPVTPATPTPTPNNPSPTPGPGPAPHPTTSASAKPAPSPLPVPSWVTIPTGLPTVIPSVIPNPFQPPP